MVGFRSIHLRQRYALLPECFQCFLCRCSFSVGAPGLGAARSALAVQPRPTAPVPAATGTVMGTGAMGPSVAGAEEMFRCHDWQVKPLLAQVKARKIDVLRLPGHADA